MNNRILIEIDQFLERLKANILLIIGKNYV